METANSKNDMGFTAFDIIGHTSKDFKSLEIQLMLTDTILKSKKSIQQDNHNPPPPLPPSTTVNAVSEVRPSLKNRWIKFKDWMENNVFRHKADWMEKRRETLGLVATVISTMSFQVAINPPGGVYQEINKLAEEQKSLCTSTIYDIRGKNSTSTFCPGQAVLGTLIPLRYKDFLLYNTVSFVASVSVIILLVTGVSITNKVVMWILIMGMCITLSSLLTAYCYGIMMTTPASIWNEVGAVYNGICILFTAVYSLIFLLLTIRFLAWVVRKCKHLIKRVMSRRTRNSEISNAPTLP